VIDQSPVSASPVIAKELLIHGTIGHIINMHTAGIIYATPPATPYQIATVRSIVVMEQELAMMSALVMIALRHGTPIPVTDAHVLTLHLSKDQAPVQPHLPLKPSLNW
jgi:hypothetical protein